MGYNVTQCYHSLLFLFSSLFKLKNGQIHIKKSTLILFDYYDINEDSKRDMKFIHVTSFLVKEKILKFIIRWTYIIY